MRIAYITCIKNEQDLIFKNLSYHYNIGIRNFYIMINNSTDNTLEEIKKFENKYKIKIKLFFDTEIAYKQPERFTMMANYAYEKDKCTWIVPVDADELIRINNNMDIYSFLKQFNQHSYGYISCRWLDYNATHKDNKEDANYFTKWKYRQQKPRPQSKIILKWHPLMLFGDGHHLIKTKRKLIAESVVMWYAHFFGRSHEQLKFKIETIGKAFIETFGKDSQRPQVLSYYKTKKQGDEYFDKVWNDLCKKRKDNFEKFIFDPIDPIFFS